MNFKEVEAIVTVSQSKSFYEAAYMLNYSPSVISKYVSNVEKEIDVAIFVRGNRAQSISLTQEGEALMPGFIRIHDCIQQLKNDLSVLKYRYSEMLRIGISGHISALGRDEIIANFLQQYPKVNIEQTKHDTIETLIHMLYSEAVDGVFLIALDGSQNYSMLVNLLGDPKIESFLIHRESTMFLGISDKEPLAEQSEAPLIAFRDFFIMFHPDQRILVKGGTLEPFSRISKESGFELKPIFIEPRDLSSFYLAKKAKIAIPSLSATFEYPGIKFIKLSDWDTFALSYFLSLKNNSNHNLIRLKKCVRTFTKQHIELSASGMQQIEPLLTECED